MATLPTTEIPLNAIPTARSTSTHHSIAHASHGRRSTSIPKETSIEKFPSVPRPAGKRRLRVQDADVQDEDQGQGQLNTMGKLYARLGRFSVAARYSLYIVPVAVILAIPIVIGATVNHGRSTIGGVRVLWFFTWIEAVWLVLWGMKFVARAIPFIFAFFAGANHQGIRRYALVLKNLEHTIMVLGWVIISFILFELLFEPSAAGNMPLGWTTWAKRVLGAILVATVIFSVEKLLVQMISVSYHARSFNDKIAESKRYVYLLAIMFDASRSLFPMYGPDFLDEDLIIHNNMEAFLKKEVKSSDGVQLRHGLIINQIGRAGRYAGRIGGRVNSIFGNIAEELTGKQVLSPRSGQSIVIESLSRTKAAKALAQRLWYSFVVEDKDQLYLSDLMEVLGPDAHELAEECFEMIDQDENGDVNLNEMIMRLTEMSLSRKAVAKSMHDVSQAIRALDSTLSAVALLLSVFALICFLDTGFSSILSTASTTLLSLSFVFSVTAQEFLGSCIFLFVKHPYDISDRVDIVGPDGLNRLVVETISLLYSSFRRVDNMELVQIPNNVLNTLWINNITRSKALLEKIELFIDFGTPLEDIELLRTELETFIRSDDHKRDFHPDLICRVLGVGSMDKLQLKLEFRHKSNWSVENVRAARHSKLMCALVLALRKVPIYGPGGHGLPLGDPGNPVYNVSVSDTTASESRDKVAQDTEAARMERPAPPTTTSTSTIPEGDEKALSPETTKTNPKALGSISETTAVDALNAKRYAGDEAIEEENDDINIDGTKMRSNTRRRGTSARSNTAEMQRIPLQRVPTRGGRRQAGMGRTNTLSGGTEGGNQQQQQQQQAQAGEANRMMSAMQASTFDSEA